jgi:hypothetical protein
MNGPSAGFRPSHEASASSAEVKSSTERFDTRPFRSWIAGLEQENVPLSRDGVFLQKHVTVG